MHPVTFHLGPITVGWYGVMFVLGLIAGLWTAARRGKRDGIAAETFFNLAPWLLGGIVLGGHSDFVITYWRESIAGKPLSEIVKIWNGGMVFYGGLIGGTLAIFLYTVRHRLSFWKLMDAIAPSIAMGHALGRIGCLLNGCCYGRPSSLSWAVCYPAGHETHPFGLMATPVHPVQTYEAMLDWMLFGALARLHGRKKFDGQIFGTYLACYAVLRSVTELFRGDYPDRLQLGWITPAHWMSAVILAFGLAVLGCRCQTRPVRPQSTPTN